MPTLGQPLAKAMIELGLFINKSEVVQKTTDAAKQITSIQVKEIKSAASQYDILAKRLGKANQIMFGKYTLLGAGGLMSAGVYKYLQTTEVGATKLRLAIGGLKYSWDQFLARIGRVIYNSEILSKVIAKLKNYLDGLDDQKIGRLFNIGAMTLALALLGKMLLTIIAIRKEFLTMTALNLFNATKGLKGAAAVAAAGAVEKVGMVQMMTGIPTSEVKRLGTAIKDMTVAFKNATRYVYDYAKMMKEYKAVSNVALGMFKTLGILWKTKGQTGSTKLWGADSEMLKPITVIMESFGKLGSFLGKVFSFLFLLDVVAAVLRGFGLNVKSGFGLLWSAIQGIVKVMEALDAVIGALMGTLESFVAILVEAVKGIFGFGSWDKLLSHLKESMSWMIPKEKSKDMHWLGESVSTVTGAGLQQASQAMITLDNQMMAIKANTEAVDRNTAAREKESGGVKTTISMGGPFANTSDLTVSGGFNSAKQKYAY